MTRNQVHYPLQHKTVTITPHPQPNGGRADGVCIQSHSAVPRPGCSHQSRTKSSSAPWAKLKMVHQNSSAIKRKTEGAGPKTPYPSCIDGNGI
ncbi:hypothetical protein Nepgr_026657 [Nepenthes gracilis]|uniref:Uncharacterized protein n=1 Tax=Nepenthes gracilis TaxID=150966 RepID=A0AAD3T9D6_NEPGR|nr:hypothetical protein Nepgr_026657 [Nepenthes gracilis]